MDGITTLIVLSAAILHATWNAFVKSDRDKLLSITGICAFTAIVGLVLAPFVGLPHQDSWPFLIGSVLAHFAYYVFLSQAYRFGDFAQVYPIARGSAPVIIVIWSLFVLNENLTSLEIGAIIGILSGILFFASRGVGTLTSNRYMLTYVLLTSVSIACYTLLDGAGGRLSRNVAAYMVWLSILDGVPLILFTIYRRSAAEIWTYTFQWRAMLGGVLSLAAYWMVVYSMSVAPIALVSALRESSIIIATLIGTFYFKEKSGYRRFVAAIIISISVIILRVYG